MNISFLHRDSHKDGVRPGRLILIFAGWGSDWHLYADIDVPGWDTAVVTDYSSITFDLSTLNDYDTIYVYAWSMGVWGATHAAIAGLKPDAAFALNGTSTPRHDSEGIPEQIYDGTHDSLNARNLAKFRMRMAGDRETARILDELLPAADIETLKTELDYIRRTPVGKTDAMRWTRVYIGDNDRIFPPESQKNFWHKHGTEIHTLTGPHYIPLRKVVKMTIHDLEKVGGRFGSALDTYDEHAHAQRLIANHLAMNLFHVSNQEAERVIEIGSGSGLFTKLWSKLMHPKEVDYIDLYPLPRYGMVPKERYHVGDAEEWISKKSEEAPGTYEGIVSASTIQWFAAPRQFFRNAAKLLNDSGFIAVSSFTKGNLAELDALRPSPIVYLTAGELKEMAEPYFSNLKVEEEEIPVSFGSARELLLHLKHTGVGGSMTTGVQGSELTRRLRPGSDGKYTLTYRAVYLTGNKK